MKTAQDVYDYLSEIEQAMWDKVKSFRGDPFNDVITDDEKDAAAMAYSIQKTQQLVKSHFGLGDKIDSI